MPREISHNHRAVNRMHEPRLLELARLFVAGGIPAKAFVERYFHEWSVQMQEGTLPEDPPELQVCLWNIYTACDVHTANEKRKEWQLDDPRLKEDVSKRLYFLDNRILDDL